MFLAFIYETDINRAPGVASTSAPTEYLSMNHSSHEIPDTFGEGLKQSWSTKESGKYGMTENMM